MTSASGVVSSSAVKAAGSRRRPDAPADRPDRPVVVPHGSLHLVLTNRTS